MKQVCVAIVFFLLFFVGCKETQSATAKSTELGDVAQQLTATIESTSELQVKRVEKTPVENLYAVFLMSGEVIYSNVQGEYFIAGDLYQIKPDVKGVENITESFRKRERLARVGVLGNKSTINFTPSGKTKSHVYVFTDVDCYYCQKLHQEVKELNAAGLEVRYLAFPRAGLNSASYQKIQSAWCASDQQDAMNKLKARQAIPSNLCPSKSVAEQYQLGQELGVRGTPTLIGANGEMFSGYMPAKNLLARLGVK